MNAGTGRLRRLVAAGLGLWLLAGAAAEVRAQQFAVEQASTELVDSVYRLNADLDYRLTRPMLHALHNGVALTLVLQIEVYRAREYWWNETIASLEQRYEIQYQALTEQYLVHNLNSDLQDSYSSLELALHSLGRVRELPVIDAHLVETEEQEESLYRIRIRLDLDSRRLPVPLQLRSYVYDEWRVGSDWYEWEL
jgi:hypothetical protein